MKIVSNITLSELKELAQNMFGELVKADIDIEQEIVILDMPMHYDGEQALLKQGSKQSNIWGINLYPEDYGTDDFIEFDSMINIRPVQGNMSRDISDSKVRTRIAEIVSKTIINE
ncbi:hypothetical protein KC853_00455 [Candidatus Saccharibacteria bacterium]|nr:hypothetical protein [Candidatus Saccharibacteria bacterium]